MSSTLDVPPAHHRANVKPVHEKPAASPVDINSLALGLKAGAEEVIQSAARTLTEVRADKYGFPVSSTDGAPEQKSLAEAVEEFERLCDRMYLLADGARGVLMQRVNDTHELVKGRVDTIVGPQMMQRPEVEEGVIKGDAAVVAYTTAAAAQVKCAQGTLDILSAFLEDYVERREEEESRPGIGALSADLLGPALVHDLSAQALSATVDDLASLSTLPDPMQL